MGDLYEKVSHKIYALPGITTCMSFFVKKEFLQMYFQNSDFSPLVWMCYLQTLNNKINTLHERCFCIMYNDKQTNVCELLGRNKSIDTQSQFLDTGN